MKGIKKNDNDDVRNFVIQTNIRFHQSGIPWQEIESNLYRLHQVLEQYIFGVLGTGEPDMITVSDKDRLAAHGFDTKTSFRNKRVIRSIIFSSVLIIVCYLSLRLTNLQNELSGKKKNLILTYLGKKKKTAKRK